MGWLRRDWNRGPKAEKPSKAKVRLEVEVNGKSRVLEIDERLNLFQVLRRKLDLVRFPGDCGRGECGGCLVLVDNEPRIACTTPAVAVQGRSVVTAEGLLEIDSPSTVPQAFQDHDVFFCGSCTSGQMMAAEGLLRADPEPSSQAIVNALSAVECNCGGQHLFFAAVEKAIELKKEQARPS